MADLKFKQICVGQYSYHGGNSFAVIGLDEDGHVWQFKRDGWIRIEQVADSYKRSSPMPRSTEKANVQPEEDGAPW